jgi:hypothetical protein
MKTSERHVSAGQNLTQVQFEETMKQAVAASGDIFAPADTPAVPTWFGLKRRIAIMLLVPTVFLIMVLGIRLIYAVIDQSNNDMERLRILETTLVLPEGGSRSEFNEGRCPGTISLFEGKNCQRRIVLYYGRGDQVGRAVKVVQSAGWKIDTTEKTGLHITQYFLLNATDPRCMAATINTDTGEATGTNSLTLYAPTDDACENH